MKPPTALWRYGFRVPVIALLLFCLAGCSGLFKNSAPATSLSLVVCHTDIPGVVGLFTIYVILKDAGGEPTASTGTLVIMVEGENGFQQSQTLDITEEHFAKRKIACGGGESGRIFCPACVLMPIASHPIYSDDYPLFETGLVTAEFTRRDGVELLRTAPLEVN